jgi:hypothetical protein
MAIAIDLSAALPQSSLPLPSAEKRINQKMMINNRYDITLQR